MKEPHRNPGASDLRSHRSQRRRCLSSSTAAERLGSSVPSQRAGGDGEPSSLSRGVAKTSANAVASAMPIAMPTQI